MIENGPTVVFVHNACSVGLSNDAVFTSLRLSLSIKTSLPDLGLHDLH